jgi:RNA polymerase sigma-70 factor, ECF subfamily
MSPMDGNAAKLIGISHPWRYIGPNDQSQGDNLSVRVAVKPKRHAKGDLSVSPCTVNRSWPHEKRVVSSMSEGANKIEERLRQAAQGDAQSWEALVAESRPRLRRMVAFRLDQRLSGRVDPSDVLQDTYLEAWQDLDGYLRVPAMPFFLWLRGIAGNKLRELHRHHLGAQMRDPRREVSIFDGLLGETTTTALADGLMGDLTRASEEAMQMELKLRLQDALNGMDPLDREVLALRHFEQLSPAETATVLGIKEKAAGMRYVRALRRLKDILNSLNPDWLEP